jgi:Domain of unknown function (DUF2760)
MDFALGLASGLIAATIFIFTIAARAGGVQRAAWGLNLAARAKADPAIAAKVDALTGDAPVSAPPPPAKAKPSGEPLRLLTLLQGEARLLDFLLEDISAYQDDQVGQAVRDIHRKAQATLKQHLELEPVIASAEGHVVSVQAGFDPSAIRVLGNVTGQPPYSGELQHAGWRVRELKLAPLPAGQDAFVLQPAEVQVA